MMTQDKNDRFENCFFSALLTIALSKTVDVTIHTYSIKLHKHYTMKYDAQQIAEEKLLEFC